MLTATQREAIFTNIPTSSTIEGDVYTAIKTWKQEWSGELDDPVIALSFASQSRIVQGAVGNRAEWDIDVLVVEVYAETNTTNGTHGSRIAEGVMQDLETWFKETAKPLLYASSISVGAMSEVKDLSFTKESVYQKYAEVDMLYKLFQA